MSLYDFVYNLQRKPAKTKKAILAVMLAVSFVALAVAWVFMFKNQMANISRAPSAPNDSLLGESEELISPVSALIEGFKGFKNDIAGAIGKYNLDRRRGEEKKRPVYELPAE